MKEQLVLFETAKLAKEKGFDVTCYAKYETWRDELKKCHVDCPENAIAEYEVADNDSYSRYGNYILEEYKNTYSKNYITAPTQSLLQKWLREIHED